MGDGQVLQFSGVTKRFGSVVAVDGFSARVEPGVVTGFLGPNGAGKTTSLRILLGLVRATEGTATIGGEPYRKLRHPLRAVGAALEASSFHPGRTAANHLRVFAQAARIPASRVDEVLGTVGLADVAGRKVGGFSLGMRQRLGLAYTLLGDPGVLVLDEPVNGLDPEGIKWMRSLLRHLAGEGRTVLVSSHLLAEVQQTVDSLLIISRGRLVFQGALHELAEPLEASTVVDAPDRGALSAALTDAGLTFDTLRSGLAVHGAEPADIGRIAQAAGVALSGLQRRGASLEDTFLDLVNGVLVHESATGAVAPLADAVAVETTTDVGPVPVEEDVPAEPVVEDVSVVGEEPVVEPEDDAEPEVGAEPETETEAEPGSEPGAEAGADAEPGSEAEPEAESEAEAESEIEADSEIEAEPVSETEPEEEDAPEEEHVDAPAPQFAVASTGVIDIVPGVERTQADIEADEFFARFDGDHDESEAQSEPEEPGADDEGGEQR